MNIDAVTVEVAKLSMGPDDRLVLRVPEHFNMHMAERFREHVARDQFFAGLRFTVLAQGVELLVVGPGDQP